MTLLLWAAHVDVVAEERDSEENIGGMQAVKRDT